VYGYGETTGDTTRNGSQRQQVHGHGATRRQDDRREPQRTKLKRTRETTRRGNEDTRGNREPEQSKKGTAQGRTHEKKKGMTRIPDALSYLGTTGLKDVGTT